jgi:diguanylate cyclase
VGRLGGDEFAVLLPNCPREKTGEIAERIRWNVFARRMQKRELSVSVGVRWIAGGAPATLEWLLTASDQHMYAAKRDGGNRVSIQAD